MWCLELIIPLVKAFSTSQFSTWLLLSEYQTPNHYGQILWVVPVSPLRRLQGWNWVEWTMGNHARWLTRRSPSKTLLFHTIRTRVLGFYSSTSLASLMGTSLIKSTTTFLTFLSGTRVPKSNFSYSAMTSASNWLLVIFKSVTTLPSRKKASFKQMIAIVRKKSHLKWKQCWKIAQVHFFNK